MGEVPALVVSGFLGSGKTTLVRYLLADSQARGIRAAVISNEFGELGIDASLLGHSAEAYVELEGGCVCCQLSDELVATLQLLYERVQPERVIIETSGIALPYDTQLNLWREPVSRWLGDDLSVVVVNAEQVDQGRELEGTFLDQVSSADLLLLNKIDLVESEALALIERRLEEWAPDTPAVRSVHCRVDVNLLFAPEPGGSSSRRRERAAAPHLHEAFDVREVPVARGIQPETLDAFLRAQQALRIKGFVDTDQGLRLVQGVGPRIELVPVDSAPEELIGRLIVVHRAGPE